MKLRRTEFAQLFLQTGGWRIWQVPDVKGFFLLPIRSALPGEAWLEGSLPTNTVPGSTTRHGWKQFLLFFPGIPWKSWLHALGTTEVFSITCLPLNNYHSWTVHLQVGGVCSRMGKENNKDVADPLENKAKPQYSGKKLFPLASVSKEQHQHCNTAAMTAWWQLPCAVMQLSSR